MLDVTLILIRVLMGAVGYAVRQEKFGDWDAIRPGIVEDRIDTRCDDFSLPWNRFTPVRRRQDL